MRGVHFDLRFSQLVGEMYGECIERRLPCVVSERLGLCEWRVFEAMNAERSQDARQIHDPTRVRFLEQRQQFLRERLRRAKAEGDLPHDESPTDLARMIWTICQGMAVQAASGATRAELRRVVARVMKSWPSP
jgi:hypothetical protein